MVRGGRRKSLTPELSALCYPRSENPDLGHPIVVAGEHRLDGQSLLLLVDVDVFGVDDAFVLLRLGGLGLSRA
jgi:hypothetical protein